MASTSTALQRGLLLAAACAAAGLASGCATKPATPEEEVAVWLSESPRTLDVRTAPELPNPRVRVTDHKVPERIAGGLGGAAYGAVYTVGGMCRGGPIGCVVGVVAAPVGAAVGAVVGAASVKSVDVHHDISAAQGAPELFHAAVKPDDLAAMLTRAVVARSEGKRHAVRVPGAGEGTSDGELRLAIRSIDLAGEIGEDPSVSLELQVSAELASPDVTAPRWGSFVYRGRSYSVSEWRAEQEALFRAELAKATESIAAELVPQLHAGPAMGAASRAAEARRRRAQQVRHLPR